MNHVGKVMEKDWSKTNFDAKKMMKIGLIFGGF